MDAYVIIVQNILDNFRGLVSP